MELLGRFNDKDNDMVEFYTVDNKQYLVFVAHIDNFPNEFNKALSNTICGGKGIVFELNVKS